MVNGAVRVPKAAELVAADVRRQIVRGSLRAGDVLPAESALVDIYGVSRPTLREALRILESERLLLVKRGAHGGAHIQTPDVAVVGRYSSLLLQVRNSTIVDILRARQALEPPVVRLIAGRDEAIWADPAGPDFHQRLVETAGNHTLALFAGALVTIMEGQAAAAGSRDDIRAALADEPLQYHVQLLDLIAAGDAIAAERLWTRHLTEAADRAAVLIGDTKVADLVD